MARPREFDVDTVVARAADLFRVTGYEATSMRDLIAHVGLSSSSIYAAFGGKHGLFLAALRHGAAQDRAMIIRALEHPAGLVAGLESLYAGLIDSLLADDASAASLTLRAALESLDAGVQPAEGAKLGPTDGGHDAGPDAVMTILREHITDLTGVVAEHLTRAQSRGEIRLSQAPSDVALFILLNAFNLTVVAKITRDRERLAAYVNAALSAVAVPATDGTAGTAAARTVARSDGA